MSHLSSIEKGLAILRELASSDQGLTVAELARLSGLNRTTVHRLCEILRRDGWVYRLSDADEATRLDLGPSVHGLAVLITNKYDSERQLRPIIDDLARVLDETVHVGSLQGARVVHVARAMPTTSLNVAAPLGSSEVAHAAALGKVLLAALGDDQVVALMGDDHLVRRTPNTITSLAGLLDELRHIRQVGFAIDDEESREGVKCVAAPVLDANGQAVLAISVTTVPQRLGGDRLSHVADALLQAASLATASCGGRDTASRSTKS